MKKYVFKNNGLPFRDEDWSRLKKIGTWFEDIIGLD
jgi:hypothetical protein